MYINGIGHFEKENQQSVKHSEYTKEVQLT